MAFRADVLLSVNARDTTTVENGIETKVNIEHPYGATKTEFTNGTGANQINLAWSIAATVNTTGTTYDLSSLTGGTGAATFTAIKGIKVKNNATTDDLVVGNAASNQFTPGFSAANTTVTVKPGGEFVAVNPTAAGWTTTSANNLKLAASANTVNTTLIVFGLD